MTHGEERPKGKGATPSAKVIGQRVGACHRSVQDVRDGVTRSHHLPQSKTATQFLLRHHRSAARRRGGAALHPLFALRSASIAAAVRPPP